MNQSIRSEPVVAIVVAAGSGSRLGADMPKALVPVAGTPLVVRAIAQLAAGGVESAVVVVPEADAEAFASVLVDAPIPVVWVSGGAERQHSVARGLAALPVDPERSEGNQAADRQVVLVHDAARAFVPADVVARVIEAVRAGADAVVPVVPVADTIREVTEPGSTVVDRARLRGVQTPQGFQRAILEDAHAALHETGASVTDDAAAAEYIGHEVLLVEGSRDAFKVTEPFDLLVAEAIAARGTSA